MSPALLVSLGAAGGTRIALSWHGARDRFRRGTPVRRHRSFPPRWPLALRTVDDLAFVLHGNHPVRLFIGSTCRPTGAGRRSVTGNVAEFFATTDGQAVLANVAGAAIGSGVPSVALQGAGRGQNWGPMTPNITILRTTAWCRSPYQLQYRCLHNL